MYVMYDICSYSFIKRMEDPLQNNNNHHQKEEEEIVKDNNDNTTTTVQTISVAVSESEPSTAVIVPKTKAHFENGKWIDPYSKGATRSFSDMWKLVSARKEPKALTKEEKEHIHPVLKIDQDLLRTPVAKGTARTTWIGHSTFFVQTPNGISFLTDPVWSDRCSPLQWLGPKRYRDVPCKIQELPLGAADFVVVSHNHYDHLDHFAVMQLKDTVHWFVPSGLKEWFNGCGVTRVTELSWWEETVYQDRYRLVCTPCKHYGQRTLSDRYATLACSWAIIDELENKKYWFAGDTAYCETFKEIGHHIGPIDFAFIPIGAYFPRWFMSEFHVSPVESVMIHQDIKAKQSVGMHWGTFRLTDEPYLEPPQFLKSEMEKANIPLEQFFAMKIGETKTLLL
ncbi:beta-lactamase-like domain-containing protein [Cavenderia fasciculata]|uniref:Beta-lactamase-like domain-containing protein n=1 Tax=Cavenderia fasciculata TaxID=261658 RepID=F4PHG3_CACFS|nr:beta-lactamase-like domain-containing protein [Cavenderia fasciculata]EGG25147.1 beta-lactamase-like domain-containing protein [Cavenderia fasciculata]|eukprot:XP_004362998.1 beta-lactamase-like domain-containing protein [Cavenderia fasciculata]